MSAGRIEMHIALRRFSRTTEISFSDLRSLGPPSVQKSCCSRRHRMFTTKKPRKDPENEKPPRNRRGCFSFSLRSLRLCVTLKPFRPSCFFFLSSCDFPVVLAFGSDLCSLGAPPVQFETSRLGLNSRSSTLLLKAPSASQSACARDRLPSL